MVLSLAAFSGTGWITSQCSTILPFSSRKMSTMADAALAGLTDRMRVQRDEIAVGQHALDLVAGVGEALAAPLDELLEALDAVGRQRIVLDVAGPEVLGGSPRSPSG